jgi:predicted nucleic acid-binding protein
MDIYFLDTSALVKRYYEEAGTDTVDELITSGTPIAISSLSVVESTSAFRRKYNRDEITENEMNALIGEFFREALDEFLIIPIEESLTGFSFDLVIEDDLRTLDSLQLSAALSLSTEEGSPTFVCADQDLVSTANRRGLDTVNPEREHG